MVDKEPMLHCVIWPTRCAGAVFAAHLSKLDRPSSQSDYVDFGFEEAIRDYYLQNHEIVPMLNDRPFGLLPPICLVRVRGMVQDVKDPEYYPVAFSEFDEVRRTTTKRSAKYLEALEHTAYLKYKFDESSLQQRIPAYLIPVPCETKWARERGYPPAKVNDFYKHLSKKVPKYLIRNDDLPEPQTRMKRGRESFQLPPPDSHLLQGRMMPYQLPLETPANVAAVSRKLYDQLDNDDLVMPTAPIEEVGESEPHRLGRDLNLPISDNFGTPVWAKFYPPQEVSVNSVVDCIGILSEAPSFSARGADLVDDSKFAGVPAPTAPRFHAILVKHLGEANPLLDIEDEEYETRKLDIFSRLGELRASLLDWMAQILGGDALSAEYLLYNIIAHPFLREDEQSTVGHMPLNFICCESVGSDDTGSSLEIGDNSTWLRSFRGRLEYLLETLLPKRHTISMSPSYLETHSLVPHSSEEFDRLESGELQLPAGTHLTLDETDWDPSLSSDRTNSQLQNLSTFIHQQSVYYQFFNYKLPFHVDSPTVVLSRGKSVFNIICTVPIHSDLSLLPPQVDEQQLEDWRLLLGLFRLTEWPEQNSEVLQAIEDDFVAIRKMPGNEYLTPELFSHWNILARTSSVSFGESMLSEARWSEIKALESDRLRRM